MKFQKRFSISRVPVSRQNIYHTNPANAWREMLLNLNNPGLHPGLLIFHPFGVIFWLVGFYMTI
jgi:hypothetical protein